MNVNELSQGILQGKWTSEDLVRYALKMIAENDQDGKKLNSIAEINGDALFIARAMDKEIRESGLRSPIHGLPVVLKDNIDVKGMHNTAGSFALNDLFCDKDAFVAKKLRDAGAVIIGKANLSEFAYWMSTQGMPSGFSSRNGQVNHAYKPGFDVSGSSSGSGVAVSARFVPISIGTETDGSLMSPAIMNAVVSIKPTIGLVSRDNILPISHVQDTAGPMGTSVTDVAFLLSVIAGKDENDAATLNCEVKDYVKALNVSIQGKRAGLIRFKELPLSERIQAAYDKAKEILLKQGCEVIELEYDAMRVQDYPLLTYEFKNDLERYLSSHNCKMRSLNDIIEFNKANAKRCLVYGQDILETSNDPSGQLIEADYIKGRLEVGDKAHEMIDGMMDKYNLDVLINPTGFRKCNFAPVSGNPCMVIPAVSQCDEDFDPVSYYFMAKAYQEDVLITFAHALEKELNVTCRPKWTEEKYW